MAESLVVQTRHFPDAVEFLEALAPWSDKSETGLLDNDAFLYRGQASSEWPLTPPAFRTDSRFLTSNGWATPPFTTHRDQIDAEFSALDRFFKISDRAGLRMPEDSQMLRHVLRKVEASLIGDKATEWPPRELLSLLALAQHSGLPTRLLDWTTDPYVAAYFAGHTRLHGTNVPGSNIVVYRIPHDLPEQEAESWVGWSEEGLSLRLISAPAADNVNLHAQRGQFTYYEKLDDGRLNVYDHSEQPKYLTLENLVEHIYESRTGVILAFTLPHTECRRLLRCLAHAGYNTSRLFPSFEGVVKFMKESQS